LSLLKVLLVTTNYWPEPTGIAVYTTDLADDLKNNKHQVTVLTSLPHYPWWKVPIEFAHLDEGVISQNGVEVIRAKHLVPPKMNALLRMRFEFSLWWNLKRVSNRFKDKKFDAVIGCIPTVAAGVIGNRIAKRLGAPFGLIVQDLSGAGAKQSGLRGGALISKVAHLVEGSALHGADSLVVVSPAMGDVVVGLGVESKKVNQILNYSARTIDLVDKVAARKRFGWAEGEFVVVHTGNMGAKQDLENVVKAADALGENSVIRIYLIGHGNQENTLRQLCASRENISVMTAVSDEDYSALLSAADLLLVNERSTQMEMSLPSKLTSYLYSERPVLAAVPRGGATWKFLDGVAELVEAADPKALAKKIEELSQNQIRLDELARLGSEFAKKHLDPQVGRAKYRQWVEDLIQNK
jgi:glycosyltransferase involved in cell wall biosynthesis